MTESEKWDKLRQIVREEVTAAINGKKVKVSFSNGKWSGITEEQLSAWKEAYPAVNIEEEIKRAAAWIVSNPGTAPKSNYSRFVNSWLERNQNRAAIRSIPVDKRSAAAGERRSCAYCEAPSVGSVSGIPHCSAHVHEAMDGRAA